jgi:type I restriction enzyme S subunit
MSTQPLDTLCSVNPETLGAATPMGMEFRYLDISAVTRGRIDWSATQLLKYADAPSRARRRLRSGDVLLCTVRPGLQAHARIRQEEDAPLVGSTGFAVLRPNMPADSGFVFHQIFSDAVAAQLRALETGSSYPAVNEGDVRRVKIYCPVKEERWRIALVLDTVDEAIAKTEALIAKLRQVRAGLLHDLLTHGLDAHGQLRDPIAHPEQFQDSPLGRIPKEWESRTLDTLGRWTGGKTPSKDSLEFWRQGSQLWVTPKDVKSDLISETEDKLSDLGAALMEVFPAGSLLIVGRSGILRHTLPVAIADKPFTVNQDLKVLVPFTNDATTASFLKLVLASREQEFLRRTVKNGTTVESVNWKDFKNMFVGWPKPAEREQICKLIASFDQELATSIAENLKLCMLKSGLMTDLLTGRVRVPEMLDSPARNA